MSERIDEIRARLAAATPGEWGIMVGAYPLGIVVVERVDGKRKAGKEVAALKPGTTEGDARMMTYGKSDVAFLLAELDRAAKVVEAARAAVDDDTLYRLSDSDVSNAGHELVSAVLEYDKP